MVEIRTNEWDTKIQHHINNPLYLQDRERQTPRLIVSLTSFKNVNLICTTVPGFDGGISHAEFLHCKRRIFKTDSRCKMQSLQIRGE